MPFGRGRGLQHDLPLGGCPLFLFLAVVPEKLRRNVPLGMKTTRIGTLSRPSDQLDGVDAEKRRFRAVDVAMTALFRPR